MGTRFLACRECQVHPNLKSKLVDTASTESTLVLGSLGDPMRVLRTELVTKIQQLEEKGAGLEDLVPLISGEKSRQAMSVGDVENSLLPCGQIVGLIHDISTMKEIVDSIVKGAIAVDERLGRILQRKS
jgi:nitronate monooxygenase